MVKSVDRPWRVVASRSRAGVITSAVAYYATRQEARDTAYWLWALGCCAGIDRCEPHRSRDLDRTNDDG